MKAIQKLLAKRWVEGGIILSMVLVSSIIFFTPNDALLNRLNAHAYEAVILFLLSGIVFMILKRPRVMFTCLGICALLCLYLKEKSKSGIHSLFNRSEADFTVCQVMINSGSDDYEPFSTSIQNSNADIISIQEVTPDWSLVLKDGLSKQYPFHTELTRIDPYGMAIYSKFPILRIDTLIFEDTSHSYKIPSLKVRLFFQGKEVDFIGCHLLPRLDNKDFEKVQGSMDSLAAWSSSHRDHSVLVAGDIGLTPWDFVLQKFITDSRLNLSRREPHLFIQPFEHILYSPGISCNRLVEVLTSSGNHIGIQGYYSFNRIQ
ncbi:MAG: endonuclease/exonuclease/phosphatase family protein [Saprospiraceae bacterium]